MDNKLFLKGDVLMLIKTRREEDKKCKFVVIDYITEVNNPIIDPFFLVKNTYSGKVSAISPKRMAKTFRHANLFERLLF